MVTLAVTVRRPSVSGTVKNWRSGGRVLRDEGLDVAATDERFGDVLRECRRDGFFPLDVLVGLNELILVRDGGLQPEREGSEDHRNDGENDQDPAEHGPPLDPAAARRRRLRLLGELGAQRLVFGLQRGELSGDVVRVGGPVRVRRGTRCRVVRRSGRVSSVSGGGVVHAGCGRGVGWCAVVGC